ncbi:Poly [ADP-ribose] polymerase [Orchesella cincta]|uniref:NAD(+) ADP-ribosyltransferase n=1 Tax=Orchesella cincta TaxID=48709 RepID=A0A1D2N575_ORCCI|nr:Poly [ADP-ribose] polymerase [Orchesella cincta]
MTTLPFKAEYAKTGRAGCKLCKTPIEKASLRLAIMVQSRFHDGKDAHWFHHGCFFQKQRPPSVGDIEDFEALRYEDQEMIKKKIGSGGAAAAAGSSGKGKGSKKAAAESATDFLVAYAKSAKSACVACEEFIPKKAVRISKKDFTSERAMLYGGGNGMDRWHHLDCFVKIREEIEFFAGAKVIPGFKDLDREDQEMLTKKLPAIAPKRKLEDNGAASEGPSKKMKTEAKGKSGKDPEEEVIRKQNKLMYKYRDLVEGGLKKPQLIQVLTTNKQIVPEGNPKAILDLIADIMTFGAMKKCTDCGSGQFSYKSGVGYQCTGYISEFTKCDYVVDGDVERVPFKIPNDLRDHEVFENYQFKMQERVIPKHAAPIKGRSFDSSGSSSGPKLNKKPLAGFKFAISGVSSKELPKMQEKIKEFGGDLGSKCNAKLAGVITTKDEFNKPSKTVQQAQKFGVPVVSTDFVTNLRELNYKLADEMKKCLLGDWVEDLQGRLKTLNDEFEKPKERRRTGGIEETHLQSIKLKLKDGAVIDPDSGLDDGPYHVYKEGKLYYNCVMNLTSVEDGKNSFYKIQVIESDGSPKSYHVFRAWGRIGTTIGGHQTDPQGCQEDAIDLFCEKYKEKTGNVWGTKFVKKPGCYIVLDIDYGQSEQEQKQLIPSLENSRLPLPVQSLISLIFDVNIMKQTLMEFELDMEKMPLGKISRKQLLEAYSVLTDSLNLRGKETDDRKLKRLITDVSNRFYTLIPHNFGTRMPPLLDNDALLKASYQ